MRAYIAIALSFSCVGLLTAANPGCSSSSPSNADSGPTVDAAKKDVEKDSPEKQCTPADAAGLLGAPSCGACLSSKCSGGEDLLKECACDPGCIKTLECLDACVADGGAVEGCALKCLGEAKGDAASIGGAILSCVGTSSSAPCNSACSTSTPTPEAGGD